VNLAIFDIDGTLARTVSVDEECYLQAFADEFGIEGINTDWGSYPSYTDSGMADHIFQEKTGESLPTELHQRLIDRFIFLLSRRRHDNPEQFAEVPGAARTLALLREEPNWKIALSTGCWLESARFKLQAAGIDISGIPLATADDSMVRTRIFRMALKRARQFYGIKHFERVVYVGDGTWDAILCRELNHPFVAIADGNSRERLRREGARTFLADYREYDLFLQALEEASVPEAKG